jgi:hypothetical protein
MTTPTESWRELLADQWEDVTDQFGPRSQAVWSAIEAICELRWFEQVGRPLEGAEVEFVDGWKRALSVFDDGGRYDLKGHLKDPVELVWPITQEPRAMWWRAAREAATATYTFAGFLPKNLDEQTRDLLWDHLHAYVSLLLAEVLAGDEVGCTYFREQLGWYAAGHFPCGWSGDWPRGRHRVL